jgi:hypothetical protein
MQVDFDEWNTVMPAHLQAKRFLKIQDYIGFMDLLTKSAREAGYKVGTKAMLYEQDEIIRIFLSRPARRVEARLSAKNRQALGWPALDKAAGQA